MENFDILEQITALVDGELKDKDKKEKINSLVNESKELNVEYKIQSIIKNTVRSKIKVTETPAYLKENVLKQIINEIPQKQPETKKESSKIFGYFIKPAFALASVIFVFALVYVLSKGGDNFQEIAAQQQGANNMYVQALSNFQSIVEGRIQPQITSNDPEEIQNFFKQQGVKYNTYVPNFDNWNLIGGVVSKDKEEILAHHVYKDSEGKLLYFYQADIGCFEKHGTLNLSEDLLKMFEKGKPYKNNLNGKNILMWKYDGKILTAVSNGSLASIENKIIQ